LAGVTLQHDVYRCSVAVGAVSNPGGMLARVGDGGGAGGWNLDIRYLRQLMGAAYAGDSQLRDISPIFQADAADAPILLIHGEDDTVVPFYQSEELEKRLITAGKAVELIKLKGEDHWMSSSATRLTMLKASIAFVQKHNPAD
jgi:dipeptidyl aminopeptidase/acylaminoacyl peptidase